MRSFCCTVLTILASLLATTLAFAPLQPTSLTHTHTHTTTPTTTTTFPHQTSLQQPRHLPTTRTTPLQSLFGLGGPELAIILVAAAFVLGPQKLAELGKDAGKIAGELKEVPKEFAKGLEEGEKEALETKKSILGEVVEKKVEEDKKE